MKFEICKSEIKRTISLSHAMQPGLGSKLSSLFLNEC